MKLTGTTIKVNHVNHADVAASVDYADHPDNADNADIINISTGYVPQNLQEITCDFLPDGRTEFIGKKTVSVPVVELSTLGAAISSLIPAFHTVTQTTSVATSGLYRLANAEIGDTLKAAKSGNFWGAFKTANGGSKMAQLQEAEHLNVAASTTMPFNPAVIMMAATLYSIEQKLSDIEKTGQEILSFLEAEKESEIEADVKTLMSIIEKYKFNWDNEHFVSGNHKLVLDIQRTARKNMTSYQKKADSLLNAKTPVISGKQVNSVTESLFRIFRYYRLSLYIFSLASLLEIMLSGDFKEENISCVKNEIDQLSMAYRDEFGKCSVYLEKLGSSSLEANVLKGAGTAGNAIGKFIGNIPVIKNGAIDEFLQNGGSKLKKTAAGIEVKNVESFASLSNPRISIFTEKMDDMIRIYNKTQDIYFDENRIYLLSD